MNVLSLFTGVGGIDLGLERAGHQIIGQCEIDAKCRAVLSRHWPGVPCGDDVRSLAIRLESAARDQADERASRTDRAGWPDPDPFSVDLVAGGFPCQDLSVAGNRAGLDGERSGLFFDGIRIWDAVCPPERGGWLLLENVPGLLSSHGGEDMAVVLEAITGYRPRVVGRWRTAGYCHGPRGECAWRVLDSQWFGVPQRRRRVFIVAGRDRDGRAAKVLLEPESGGGHPSPGSETRPELAATLTRGSARPGASAPGRRQEDDVNLVGTLCGSKDKGGWRVGADEAAAGHLVVAPTLTSHVGARSPSPGPLVSGTLTARHGKGPDSDVTPGQIITHTLTAAGYDASEDGTGRGTPLTSDHGLRRLTAAVTSKWRKGTGGPAGDECQNLVSMDGVRRLAPVECERLQGFPDGWTIPDETDWREHPRPDGPRYAQMGNAVTVPVAEWIGCRLMAAAGKDGDER